MTMDVAEGAQYALHWALISLAYACVGHIIFDAIFARIPLLAAKSGQQAFLAVAASGIFVVILSFCGMQGWFIIGFPEDRLYGTQDRVYWMCGVMLGYQIYDTLTALLYKELFSIPMLVHHLVTGSLAVSGVFSFFQGHSDYFFGVIETSNIPLTFMDAFKTCPTLIKRYPKFYIAVRMVFAVNFVIVRLVFWAWQCSVFYMDIYEAISSGRVARAERLGFMELPVVIHFMVSNIILTYLQVSWGIVLIKGVLKQIRGKRS